MQMEIRKTVIRPLCVLALACVTLHHRPTQADDGLESKHLIAGGLVYVQRGDLPIILSAPHGGREIVDHAAQRIGVGVKMFNPVPDLSTDRLTYQLADAIEKKSGKRPYVIVARFHRKYVDANRRQSRAYESERAKSAYETFHQSIAQSCAEVVERWGRGVLLDVHGQSTHRQAIVRGTSDGKTTSHLVNRFGMQALIGRQSLIGHFASNDLPVLPEVDSAEPEPSQYDGGFIVNAYGSRNGGTIDAIQLEVGMDLRRYDARPETAEKMADGILSFASDFLPADPNH